MKTFARRFPFLMLLSLLLAPLAVGHASSPPDFEPWERDYIRPAAKPLATKQERGTPNASLTNHPARDEAPSWSPDGRHDRGRRC